MTESSKEEESNQDEISVPLISRDEGSSSYPEEEEEEYSPVKQVTLTVPIGDDPSLPVLTFRMWVLGTLSCVLLSFLNQFFWYRTEPLSITAILAQIAVVPLGQLMASSITTRIFLKGNRWEFTLNLPRRRSSLHHQRSWVLVRVLGIEIWRGRSFGSAAMGKTKGPILGPWLFA